MAAVARHRRLGGTVERRVAVEVEQHFVEAGGADSVEQRVVDLQEQRDALVLESLDDPELPRGTVAVELRREQVAGEPGELTPAAGGRCTDPVHMGFDVHLRIVDPRRHPEMQRGLDEAPVEGVRSGIPLGAGRSAPARDRRLDARGRTPPPRAYATREFLRTGIRRRVR